MGGGGVLCRVVLFQRPIQRAEYEQARHSLIHSRRQDAARRGFVQQRAPDRLVFATIGAELGAQVLRHVGKTADVRRSVVARVEQRFKMPVIAAPSLVFTSASGSSASIAETTAR